MKIYVLVEDADYDWGYQVLAVCSTPEKAAAAKIKALEPYTTTHTRDVSGLSPTFTVKHQRIDDNLRVEEYELDAIPTNE